IFSFQIAGIPGWVQADGYDVAAKAGGDLPVREFPPMLRSLLEDRFQLKTHWETRKAAVYDLVVSKAGRLREAEGEDCPSILDTPGPRPGDPPDDAPCGELMNAPGHTKGYRVPASELAGGLSFFLGKLVRDKTGLTGKYDIELQWTPDGPLLESPSSETGPPSIFTALQQQLGLKLESARGPVKILVIDHVERPTEN
ncbi:MAG: TIGR03435 family protein, partial [Acidobacteriia bacterium]|nr:TIGR03435 family protein [Terriglobia bacterium]MBV8905914.1 TIGR03435 family protein [Terriglobia bacterium]